MKFFVFAASHRRASFNRILAKHAADYTASKGHEVLFEEYLSLDMPPYNDELSSEALLKKTKNLFAERTAAVDGLIISSPEYNWSYPGTLKNILDWTSRLAPCPLAGKTVLLLSATPAMRGGLNGLMHLRAPFEALRATVFPRVFPLGNVEELLAGGTLQDERQKHILMHLVDDYLTFTHKLRS